MSEFVGALLIISAIFFILFGIRDILTDFIRRIKFTNLSYMYGFGKRDRHYFHRWSARKKKSAKHSRQLENPSENDQTVTADLSDTITIPDQPIFPASEPMEDSAESHDQIDEEILAEIDLFKDSKSSAEPASMDDKQIEFPVPPANQPKIDTKENVHFIAAEQFDASTSTIETKPAATPDQSRHGADEKVDEKISLDEIRILKPKPSSSRTKSTETPPPSPHAFDLEYLDFIKRSKLPDTSLKKTEPISTPVKTPYKLTQDIIEKINEVDGISAGLEPSVKKTKPIRERVEVPDKADKPNSEDNIIIEDVAIHLSPLPTEIDIIVTPRTSEQQKAEARIRDTYHQEQGEIKTKLSATEKKRAEISKQFSIHAGKMDKSDITILMRNYNFYDAVINPNGQGLFHHYIAIELACDQIIIDKATNLIWQQNGSPTEMTFDGAKKWLERLNRESHAGFQDWRFPTLAEAMSLMENELNSHDLYIAPFFNKIQQTIWTSNFQTDQSQRWVVSFAKGFCDLCSINDRNYIRAVRQDEEFIKNLVI